MPARKRMTDIELLREAIDLSEHSARSFALYVLDVDERTVRYWLAGDRSIPGPVRQLCRAILSGAKIPEAE